MSQCCCNVRQLFSLSLLLRLFSAHFLILTSYKRARGLYWGISGSTSESFVEVDKFNRCKLRRVTHCKQRVIMIINPLWRYATVPPLSHPYIANRMQANAPVWFTGWILMKCALVVRRVTFVAKISLLAVNCKIQSGWKRYLRFKQEFRWAQKSNSSALVH